MPEYDDSAINSSDTHVKWFRDESIRGLESFIAAKRAEIEDCSQSIITAEGKIRSLLAGNGATRLRELGLPLRVETALVRKGYYCIEAALLLLDQPPDVILSIRNFGTKALVTFLAALVRHGDLTIEQATDYLTAPYDGRSDWASLANDLRTALKNGAS